MIRLSVSLLSLLRRAVLLAAVLAAPCRALAQSEGRVVVHPEDRDANPDDPTFVPMVKVGRVMYEGDSVQYMELNDLWVYPTPTFKNARQRAAYNRLVANVKKVLPIAKEVNGIIIETYEYLQTLPDKRSKDEHLKRVERDIRKQYTPRMKKLTYQQGKLLIKLVYRECNSTSYQLIQAFLGPIRAGFYQAFASLFGASLTKKYDPEGVDKYTERIVLQVEAGQL